MKSNLKYIFGCLIIFIVLVFSSKYEIHAINTSEGEILILNGKTIKKDTTLTTLNSYFGQPQITSENAYGGTSYTFYDNTLLWYLHVEMDGNSKIRALGCLSDSFESAKFKSGEKKSYVFNYMGGRGFTKYREDTISGCYVPVNMTNAEITEYYSRFLANEGYYTYQLQAPSLAAYEVFEKMRGNTVGQEVLPLEIYDYVEKLHDNNVNIYNYARATSKTSAIKLAGSVGTNDFYEYLPNPLAMAESASGYKADESTFKYMLFELNAFNALTTTRYKVNMGTFFIDPTFIVERKKVELTDEEKIKMEKITEAYNKYDTLASETVKINAFDIQPQYTTYPLTAGKLNVKHLQLSTYFLNTIRAGIGLEGYELNEDMANSAQYKAALNTYLNNYYNGEDKKSSYGHNYAKPSGIDQEFYDTAMKYGNENLFMGNHLTGVMYAIDDFSDKPYCGHRQSLLYPYFTDWGIGWVGAGSLSLNLQSCQKFGGHRASDIEIVAWPANGITFLDAMVKTNPYWTCDLYKGHYNFSTIDKVVVKNLSTDQVYEITDFVKNSTFVGFEGDSITFETGDVFEITLKNVTNTDTNAKQDYSYRSVFQKFDGLINADGENLNTPETATVAINKENKLPVTLESESDNKLLRFSSSNEDVVTVRPNGVIKGVSNGTAIITVKSALGSEKTIQVTVLDYLKGDMNEDNFVNSTDAAIVLDRYKNSDATIRDYDIGDMNEDNILNSTDAAMILDIYKNK